MLINNALDFLSLHAIFMIPQFPLHRSLPDLATGLRDGSLDVFDYLDQLEPFFDEREPDVLAFVPENGRLRSNRFLRLRTQALALLKQYPNPANRPPLFCVPVGVKDIFHVDGFVTRAGSNLPADLFQGAEAASVTALKNAGALILGKTITTEFAYFGAGETRNPYNREHTPGGSSSGSAAAVGAGMAALTLGTQTIGSINRPAAFCGAVGYKPSYGRIAKTGVLPLSASTDHVGLFAKTAVSAQFAAQLMVNYWQPTSPSPALTVGVPEGRYLEHADDESLAHFRATCAKLQAAGVTVKPIAAMPDFDTIAARHAYLVDAEMATIHADWFAIYPDLYQPKTAEHIQMGENAEVKKVGAAINGRFQLRTHLTDLMAQHGITLWLSPSAVGPAPHGLDGTGSPIMNLPWSYAGLPTITLPSGFAANGLPLGLQLAGGWYADEALFTDAIVIEDQLGLATPTPYKYEHGVAMPKNRDSQ